MRLINSKLESKIIKSYDFDLGTLHLLENVVVSEINEGKHISVKTADEYIATIAEFYGEEKAFGYISNRINSFSVEALDYTKFTGMLTNLKVFSAVAYKYFDEINIDVEQQFCNIPYKKWNSLIDAYNYINEFINQTNISIHS